MALPQSSGQEYKIESAIITSDRNSDEYDVKSFIAEVSFFEHIQKPYVTGQIAIMDDHGIISALKFKGTELITITISAVDEALLAEGLTFTHTFLMKSIIKTFKTTEKTEIYVFELIDPHAFLDSNIRISRSYKGKIEEIVKRIVINDLGLDIDFSYYAPSAQSAIKVIVPYLSPLQACDWLLDRATSVNGSPYFLWATLYDFDEEGTNALRLGNLDTMLKAPVFNENNPYLFSTAAADDTALLPLEKQAVIVKNIKTVNIEDTSRMVNEGAIGSSINSLDTFTSQKYSRHFRVSELLDKLKDDGVIPDNSTQNVFDSKQLVESPKEIKSTEEYNSVFFNTVTSFGTYGNSHSYHDVFNQSQALHKVRQNSLRSLLTKNMIDVTIPGIAFFAALKTGQYGKGKGVSVGDIVKIDFLNSDVDATEIKYDEERSGYYLIWALRNLYKDTVHNIVMTITKLNDNPKI